MSLTQSLTGLSQGFSTVILICIKLLKHKPALAFSQLSGRRVDIISHFVQESHTLFPWNPAEQQPQVPSCSCVCQEQSVESLF